jgi:single-stranded DNA-binding protein
MIQNQGVNKVILVGYIHGRPEWRTIANSRCLCFQFLTIENINRQGAVHQHTEKHILRVPESIIENAGNDFREETELYVEGKINTCSSVDNTGIKRYDTTIIVGKYNVMAKTSAQVLSTM